MQLNFELDQPALQELIARRFGRTVLVTSRAGWSAEEAVEAYAGQQQAEQVCRGLKQGGWVGWGPMHHWTDSQIRVHAFYCMLGLSLRQHVRRKAEAAWPGLSVEELKQHLGGSIRSSCCTGRRARRGRGAR